MLDVLVCLRDIHKESWQPGWECQRAQILILDHSCVCPLTSFFPVQVIQMSQHREALSSLMGSSPLVLHGVYRLFGFGMILRLSAIST
ncbi:hypothetical protein AVEN_74331-1 [Araneus ventricosus]|uniref:Uncharacterized protein n=1 Tax=Araneus ventricosus TaxID=182803 RepID=A0A4Y2HN08_ARAVE|nr:hypothetical protein AVEN_74331-1 [Araneus ventricosus]